MYDAHTRTERIFNKRVGILGFKKQNSNYELFMNKNFLHERLILLKIGMIEIFYFNNLDHFYMNLYNYFQVFVKYVKISLILLYTKLSWSL